MAARRAAMLLLALAAVACTPAVDRSPTASTTPSPSAGGTPAAAPWSETLRSETCAAIVAVPDTAQQVRDRLEPLVAAANWEGLIAAADDSVAELRTIEAAIPRSTGSGVIAPLLIVVHQQLEQWTAATVLYGAAARRASAGDPAAATALAEQARGAMDTAMAIYERDVAAQLRILGEDHGFTCPAG